MSNVFTDIKIKAKSKETINKLVDAREHKSQREVVSTSPTTKRRGRPRKEHVENAAHKNEKSTEVTYLTPAVKAKLQEVQALLLIKNKKTLKESEIVDRALNYLIRQDNLK